MILTSSNSFHFPIQISNSIFALDIIFGFNSRKQTNHYNDTRVKEIGVNHNEWGKSIGGEARVGWLAWLNIF